MQIRLVGIDLAKNVFQLCALNRANKVVFNRSVRRARLLDEVRKLPPTLIAMEACSSAHYWGRVFQALGHKVLLIPPQHVKAFVRNGKSDRRDALAICEAAQRPDLHPVPVKSVEQQDLQVLHRVRQRYVSMRTALVNQIRGIACEYGVYFPEKVGSLRQAVPIALEDAENALSDSARALLRLLLDELYEIDDRKLQIDHQVRELSQAQEAYRRLQEVPTFGPIVASAFLAAIGSGAQFTRGRQVGAWAGLVPRQHGTGGKLQLYGITKNGDRYLRTQLVHGARAVVGWVKRRPDDNRPIAKWVRQLIARRGVNKTVVALANKMARVGWAVLARGEHYDANKAFAAR